MTRFGSFEVAVTQESFSCFQRNGGLDQASRSHLRNLDVYVMRLLEETAEGRDQMTQEIRSEIKLLARTIAAIAEEERQV